MKHLILLFSLSLLFFTSFSQEMNSEGQYTYDESVLSDVDYMEVSTDGWSVVYAKSNVVVDDNFNWIPLIRRYSRMKNYYIRTMTKEDYLEVADDLLMSLDGVESTMIMSKYQLEFDIGKFFDESEVSDLIINTLTCKNE